VKFKKGQSGNPGGRPKESHDVKMLARKYTAQAIERLAFWLASDNPKASVSAAAVLLDRGWGKATQPISGEAGAPAITRSSVSSSTLKVAPKISILQGNDGEHRLF
jgi:hypothetical protein